MDKKQAEVRLDELKIKQDQLMKTLGQLEVERAELKVRLVENQGAIKEREAELGIKRPEKNNMPT